MYSNPFHKREVPKAPTHQEVQHMLFRQPAKPAVHIETKLTKPATKVGITPDAAYYFALNEQLGMFHSNPDGALAKPVVTTNCRGNFGSCPGSI